MKFNTGKYKKTLDQTLDIFDEFLDNMTASKISNEDYRTIHKIFDKYLKNYNQAKKERRVWLKKK